MIKTEVLLSSKKQTGIPLKLTLNGTKLQSNKSVKYLGVKIDESFTWKRQISYLVIKLNRENAILSKLRHFIDRHILKSIYHAKLELYIFSSLVSAQNSNLITRTFVLQQKSLRIINFP